MLKAINKKIISHKLLSSIYELHLMPKKEVDKLIPSQREIYEKNLYIEWYSLREIFCKEVNWSIICEEMINLVKKYARPPIYDIMAGTGFFATALNSVGIETIPSDISIPPRNKYVKKQYCKIRKCNALKVVREFNKPSDIILSWPPYGCKISHLLLRLLPSKSRVFYIGEFWDCCGSEEMIDEFEKNFKMLEEIEIPKFDCIHDTMMVWEKN